jgi:hypothetical protein
MEEYRGYIVVGNPINLILRSCRNSGNAQMPDARSRNARHQMLLSNALPNAAPRCQMLKRQMLLSNALPNAAPRCQMLKHQIPDAPSQMLLPDARCQMLLPNAPPKCCSQMLYAQMPDTPPFSQILNYPSYARSQMPTGSTAAAVGQLPSELASKSSSEAAQRYIMKQFQCFYN